MPADLQTETPRVAVVGAGISGLAAAHRLREVRPDAALTLFESADRLGGVLQTVRRDGFLIERSADNFLTKTPWATSLCNRLGLTEELLPTARERRRALVVSQGQIKPTPEGFVITAPKRLGPLLRSDVLSFAGRLRAACEPLVPARGETTDESVAAFARRRLGREAFERLVQPLVGGIYTADLERLSLDATLPEYRDQERRHGSLWRAARAESRQEKTAEAPAPTESGARYGAFLAPREGMSQLVEALAERLGDDAFRKRTTAGGLNHADGAWELTDNAGKSLGLFDGVILATPSHATSRIVAGTDKHLANQLAAIEYAGSVVVCLGYQADQLPSLPTGFGFVVPACERRQILAASFSSLKYPGRAPDDRLLVRVFIGGALQATLTKLRDEELVRLAAEELADLLKTTGQPQPLEVARWPNAMPQYHVGHLDRVTQIEERVATHRGLELAGAAYRGVGIPQCIESGEQAAQRLAAWLR